MAQKDKRYLALDTDTILDGGIHSLWVYSFHGFITKFQKMSSVT